MIAKLEFLTLGFGFSCSDCSRIDHAQEPMTYGDALWSRTADADERPNAGPSKSPGKQRQPRRAGADSLQNTTGSESNGPAVCFAMRPAHTVPTQMVARNSDPWIALTNNGVKCRPWRNTPCKSVNLRPRFSPRLSL